EDGKQVDAITRIGQGPWYDRIGRLIANDLTGLMATRPTGADSSIINDLPNEDGVANHQPDPSMGQVDNHDTLTGTNAQGTLYGANATCSDWTSSAGDSSKRPRVGHSWTRMGGIGGGGNPFAADGGMVPGAGMFPGDGGTAMGGRGRGQRMGDGGV